MPVAVQMPSQRGGGSAIDRLASILGIVQGVRGMQAYSAKQDEEQKLKDALARRQDAKSQESAQVRSGYSQLGLNVPETMSAADAEHTYGKLAELNQKKFAEGLHRGTLEAKELAEAKRNPAKREFDLRPPEAQEQIKDIAKAMATKADIKNEIDTALELLRSPNVSEDQKVAAGQGLLKTLNSTQGKDAVGAEEAQRLSNFLEFKKFNFTQPGSMFGRDLNEFTDQVGLVSSRLSQAYDKDSAKIDSLYGRSPKTTAGLQLPQFQGKSADPKFSLVPNAMADQGGAPAAPSADPKVAQYAKQHGLDYNMALGILQKRGYGR
jgi:hypothetical protein